MTPLVRLRLEKAASDCGFDLTPRMVDDGSLELRSAAFPEALWIRQRAAEDDAFHLSASSRMMLDALGADSAQEVLGFEELYTALQRASAVARTMPNRVAEAFQQATKMLPRSTEVERIVVQRVGQDLFRGALLDYWQGRCCVTGLSMPSLLRASHIKPWNLCGTDEERLDVFNGLLLAPHVDALFDGGWISFSDSGAVLISSALPAPARTVLGVSADWKIGSTKPAHAPYLAFHRANEFRGSSPT
ncbi:HNH endonuclease [Roseateles sp. So40a]|uniref:HNH endonuclease n=1 Tax=Roseateles sp. So40a TaxID=3400226 RepID=UPI003A869BD6